MVTAWIYYANIKSDCQEIWRCMQLSHLSMNHRHFRIILLAQRHETSFYDLSLQAGPFPWGTVWVKWLNLGYQVLQQLSTQSCCQSCRSVRGFQASWVTSLLSYDSLILGVPGLDFPLHDKFRQGSGPQNQFFTQIGKEVRYCTPNSKNDKHNDKATGEPTTGTVGRGLRLGLRRLWRVRRLSSRRRWRWWRKRSWATKDHQATTATRRRRGFRNDLLGEACQSKGGPKNFGAKKVEEAAIVQV